MLHVDPDINQFVQDCFEEALAGYSPLHDHTIHLRRKYLKDMTMRAQPMVNGGFFRKSARAYRVDIQDHTRINESVRVPDLPQRVLVGWFAHELGHVMDYHQRSWSNLIKFGLGYLLFPTFRVGAERKADLYAIEYGFAEAITATKEFLLTESSIPNSYKNRLTRYYMTPEEVEIMVKKRESGTIFRDRII
jgi:hypothetical protein